MRARRIRMGTRRTRGGRSPYRSSARRRPPRHGPRQLAAPAERANRSVRERAILPGAIIVEAEQDPPSRPSVAAEQLVTVKVTRCTRHVKKDLDRDPVHIIVERG